MKKIFALTLVAFTLFSSSTFSVMAATSASEIGTTISDNLDLAGGAAGLTQEQREADVRDVAVNVINGALTLFGIAFTFLLIWGGWTWMTAAGNQDNIDKAKKILQWATIGIAIVIVSYAFSVFVAENLLKASGNVSGLEL